MSWQKRESRAGEVWGLGDPKRRNETAWRKCQLSGWPLAMTGFLGPGTAVCHSPNHNLGVGDWGCLGLSPGGDLSASLGGAPASQTGLVYPGSLSPVNGMMGSFSPEKGMFPPEPKEGEASLAPSDATRAAALSPSPRITAPLPLRERPGGGKGQRETPLFNSRILKCEEKPHPHRRCNSILDSFDSFEGLNLPPNV